MAKNTEAWGRETARKRYAEGGEVKMAMMDKRDAENMGPPRGGESTTGGGKPVTEYYGTSREPSIGKRIEGPSNPGNKRIYPNTPEGRKSMNRTIDKYDNAYGAYRHRGRDVADE